MNRLKELRAKENISQQKLANELNVARSTIAMLETGGSQPDNNDLIRLSNYFHVAIDYVLGRDLPNEEDPILPQGVKIPVLGYVRAGFPIYAEENIIEYEEISTAMAARGEFFGLKIKGG